MELNNFKLILIQDNVKTTMIVRNRNNKVSPRKDHNSSQTLELLGLEKVPYKELVPGYKKIISNDLGKSCSICQEEYKLNEHRRILVCDHGFHRKCIDKWMKNNLSCPICRKDIGM